MKNSIFIINQEKASLSKLGYDEIRVVEVTFNRDCIKNDTDDYFMGLLYDCECSVKMCDESFLTKIPLVIIEDELKRGIYNILSKG